MITTHIPLWLTVTIITAVLSLILWWAISSDVPPDEQIDHLRALYMPEYEIVRELRKMNGDR
jgi:hypothetical protein